MYQSYSKMDVQYVWSSRYPFNHPTMLFLVSNESCEHPLSNYDLICVCVFLAQPCFWQNYPSYHFSPEIKAENHDHCFDNRSAYKKLTYNLKSVFKRGLFVWAQGQPCTIKIDAPRAQKPLASFNDGYCMSSLALFISISWTMLWNLIKTLHEY